MTTPYRIRGETGEWEVVIGLEVHAQVTSRSKLFSGASATYGGGTEHPCEPGGCRDARHVARDQRRVRRAGGAHRSRAWLRNPPLEPVRP